MCYAVVELLSTLMLERNFFGRTETLLMSFLGLLGVAYIAGLTVLIVGTWLCCTVPANARQKAWTIGIVVGEVFVGLMLFVIAVFGAQMDNGPDDFPFDGGMRQGLGGVTPRTLQLMTYVVFFAAVVTGGFFTCLLAGLAGYFRAWGLRVSLLSFLGLSLLVDLLFFALYVLEREGRLGFDLARSLVWLRLAIYVPLIVWLIIQIFLVRGLITDALTRNWSADAEHAFQSD